MLNQVFNEDCLEGMKRIPDKSVDMILTDPPYLMNYRSGRRSQKFEHIAGDRNSHDLIKDFFKEADRVLKDDTSIYVFCSWHHVDFFKKEFETYFNLKNIIVWNKNNHGSGDLRGSYAPKHEFVLYGHKGRSLFREKRIPDVIDCAKIPGAKLVHPTEKPTELLDIFIKNSTDLGALVLDPFTGCGSTAVSALNNGRKFTGFEISTEYSQIANERIAAHKLKETEVVD